MITYVHIQGAPKDIVDSLPRFKTLEELENYLFNLEAELDNIEIQLDAYERFDKWPRSGTWESSDIWLEAVLEARRFKTWKRSIVKATLNRDVLKRLSLLEEKVFQMDSILARSRQANQSNRSTKGTFYQNF